MQRSAIPAGGNLAIDFGGVGERLVAHQQREGVQVAAVLRPGNRLTDELGRRDAARTQQRRGVGDAAPLETADHDDFAASGADGGLLADSARRSAAVDFASVSSSGFNSGSPRCSASATAAASQASTVMVKTSTFRAG